MLRRSKPLRRSPLKWGPRKVTGEAALFREIFQERGGRCEITGKNLEFNVNCFMHILSKGAYERYRLNAENIMLVDEEIHRLYDKEGISVMLDRYPQTSVVVDKLDDLRARYNSEKHYNTF